MVLHEPHAADPVKDPGQNLIHTAVGFFFGGVLSLDHLQLLTLLPSWVIGHSLIWQSSVLWHQPWSRAYTDLLLSRTDLFHSLLYDDRWQNVWI